MTLDGSTSKDPFIKRRTVSQHLDRILKKGGYAADLIGAFTDGTARLHDADSLFRTLVLDEDMSVVEARELWRIAVSMVGEE